MRLTPSTARAVAGIATGGLLAGGLLVHVASAAEYTCPTYKDAAGDTTAPGDADVDLTAVTYTVVGGRFQAVLQVATLGTSGPRLGSGDIFRTTFTVASLAASFSVQRDGPPTSTFTVTGTIGGKAVKTGADFSTAKNTVTLSAAVADLETAAGVSLTGEAFTLMKASTSTVSGGLPSVPTITDSAAAPADATYLFGDTCAGATPTDAPTDTAAPTDTPTATDSPTPSSTATASPTAGTGTGGYVGLTTPVRVLDTRSGSRVGNASGPISGSVLLDLTTKVPATAKAVVLNVTSTGSNAPGYLVAYRAGQTAPTTSSLNWPKGKTQANEVTAAIDSNRTVEIDVKSAGSTQVVADLLGYLTDDSNETSAGTISLITPKRLFDNRIQEGATKITLGAADRPVGTSGAIVNVTLVKPAADTFLAVYPGDQERPTTSTVNATTTQIQSNQTFVRLDTDGSFNVDLGLGVARVVVDLLGTYGTGNASSGTAVPLEKPVRLLDTRNGTGGTAGKRTSGSTTPVVIPNGSLPPGAVGIILQATTNRGTAGGFITVHPGGTTAGSTSTLNLTSIGDRAQEVYVALGTGNPNISVGGGGAAFLVADVIGYVVIPGSTASPTPDPSSTDTPTADPSASSTDTPTADPSATATDTPTADPSGTPTATGTPKPTATPCVPGPPPLCRPV